MLSDPESLYATNSEGGKIFVSSVAKTNTTYKCKEAVFTEAAELGDSNRGAGGFGSSRTRQR